MTVRVVFLFSRYVEEILLFQFPERQLRLFEKAMRVGQILLNRTPLLLVEVCQGRACAVDALDRERNNSTGDSKGLHASCCAAPTATKIEGIESVVQ